MHNDNARMVAARPPETRDPRTRLAREKYFSLRPIPLERWLWKQNLPPAAERVFWLHWQAGHLSGDWCSEIPVRQVARECCIDVSTVTRAYQALKKLGLIKREDPGKNPNNPFAQATFITEVRIPRELLVDLAAAPNRGVSVRMPTAAAASTVAVESPATPSPSPAIIRRTREEIMALWSRVSPEEGCRYHRASQNRATSLTFDTDTQLSPTDRRYLLDELERLANARPSAPKTRSVPAPSQKLFVTRKLNALDQLRVRKQILELASPPEGPNLFRQVVWAMEEGALRQFPSPMALNIALKKIREGAWNRPSGMPAAASDAQQGGVRAPRPA